MKGILIYDRNYGAFKCREMIIEEEEKIESLLKDLTYMDDKEYVCHWNNIYTIHIW